MHRTARTVSAAVALGATFALTACGGSGAKETAADAKQTITVWGFGTEGEKLQEVADAYEKKHPNITVKVTPIGWDVAHQKLVSAAAAGTLPDMAQMGTTFMGEMADLGVLEPVDTKKFDKGDFFPAAWGNNVFDDKVYGVPWYVDTRVLYYRTDLAKKAGVDKAPTTWKELSSLAAKYQDKADTKWGISLQPNGLDTNQNWLPFLYSAGGDLVKDGKPSLDTPATVEALKEYAAYFDKGLAKKSLRPGYDVTKDFGNGSVPMFLSGPWITTSLAENQPQLKGKWGVAPIPAGPDGKGTSFAGGSNLVAFKDSEHKAAATDFISYLTSTEQQVDWHKRTTDLPANREAWEGGKLGDNPNLEIFRTQMDNAKAVPPMAKWAEFGARLDSGIESVIQGKATPEQAAKKMQSSTAGLVE
ncbi:sugar ABC transporter substrate-binding protein [Streptomyces meridianus]|uniref:Sugar ABC transporter substrate-binding protein n=1 Tax=Streptomyces meridianus TaxID=2938945 RepID=A0ABT0X0Z5_9ACTN|nr:sugar ABC transporter substrate-binding protein [Streptomyces meridianus]MCM2576237.1 sugar ABC transporter substrate-binding protein [Streptomyces meridianus]